MKTKSKLGWGKKYILFFCVALVGYASGTSFTTLYASHLVAGVDYPYDPANYYNPVSISWADSAPSPFVLRDLAAQGGSVYDYTRHIKSILYGTKFSDWQKLIQQGNELEEENMKHRSESERQDTINRNVELTAKISSSYSTGMLNLPDYMTNQSPGDESNEKVNKQAAYLNQVYLDSSKAIQSNVESTMDVYEALQIALEHNSKAETTMQIKEVQEEIAALDVLAKNILSNIYGEKSTVNNAVHAIEELERVEQLESTRNYNNRILLNPYDEHDLQIIKYNEEFYGKKHYESKGMPDF